MLPNLIIIGAGKCGTTSLHRYLDLHPEISMSENKEPNFFGGPGWSWDRGLDWYESLFPEAARIRGESSHTYTIDPIVAGVPERIRSTLPEVKLIYLVGDPVERIVSQYVGEYAKGAESRSLAALCASPNFAHSGYMYRSRFHHQLTRYLECFPREAIHVLSKEDLARDPAGTIATTFRFLGVDDSFTSPDFGLVHNPSSAKRRQRGYVRAIPGMGRVAGSLRESQGRIDVLTRGLFSRSVERPTLDNGLRAQLIAALEEDVAKLRQLTGMAFETWCL
jgi:hypothetical protein